MFFFQHRCCQVAGNIDRLLTKWLEIGPLGRMLCGPPQQLGQDLWSLDLASSDGTQTDAQTASLPSKSSSAAWRYLVPTQMQSCVTQPPLLCKLRSARFRAEYVRQRQGGGRAESCPCRMDRCVNIPVPLTSFTALFWYISEHHRQSHTKLNFTRDSLGELLQIAGKETCTLHCSISIRKTLILHIFIG